MYVIEQKVKCWRGDYWSTDFDWYEWQQVLEIEEFAKEETAIKVAKGHANNPYRLGVRVVNKENGEVIKEFEYWKGEVVEK